MKTCTDMEQVILMCSAVSSLACECCLLLTLACFIYSYILTDTGSVKHTCMYVKSPLSSIRLLQVQGFAPTIILIVFFCKVNIFPLLDKLSKKSFHTLLQNENRQNKLI